MYKVRFGVMLNNNEAEACTFGGKDIIKSEKEAISEIHKTFDTIIKKLFPDATHDGLHMIKDFNCPECESKILSATYNDGTELVGRMDGKFDGGEFNIEIIKEQRGEFKMNNNQPEPIEKGFLVLPYDIESDSEILVEKINDFVLETFGEANSKDINVKVEYNCGCIEECTEFALVCEIEFKKYTYNNKVYGEQPESIGFCFEDKGFQPFYIDGKFVSMNIFAQTQRSIIQKAKEIYGYDPEKLLNEFNDYLMTC